MGAQGCGAVFPRARRSKPARLGLVIPAQFREHPAGRLAGPERKMPCLEELASARLRQGQLQAPGRLGYLLPDNWAITRGSVVRERKGADSEADPGPVLLAYERSRRGQGPGPKPTTAREADANADRGATGAFSLGRGGRCKRDVGQLGRQCGRVALKWSRGQRQDWEQEGERSTVVVPRLTQALLERSELKDHWSAASVLHWAGQMGLVVPSFRGRYMMRVAIIRMRSRIP